MLIKFFILISISLPTPSSVSSSRLEETRETWTERNKNYYPTNRFWKPSAIIYRQKIKKKMGAYKIDVLFKKNFLLRSSNNNLLHILHTDKCWLCYEFTQFQLRRKNYISHLLEVCFRDFLYLDISSANNTVLFHIPFLYPCLNDCTLFADYHPILRVFPCTRILFWPDKHCRQFPLHYF